MLIILCCKSYAFCTICSARFVCTLFGCNFLLPILCWTACDVHVVLCILSCVFCTAHFMVIFFFAANFAFSLAENFVHHILCCNFFTGICAELFVMHFLQSTLLMHTLFCTDNAAGFVLHIIWSFYVLVMYLCALYVFWFVLLWLLLLSHTFAHLCLLVHTIHIVA